MPAASFLRRAYLRFLSKPKSERILYRAVRNRSIHSIVELGIGNGRNAHRLLELILHKSRGESVRYTGVDLFEARPQEAAGMSLKEAFVWSKKLGARVELIPGDPYTALSRAANRLTDTDVLIIRNDQDPHAIERAWLYVPRMLHENSLVFVETTESQYGYLSMRQLSIEEVHCLANHIPIPSRLKDAA